MMVDLIRELEKVKQQRLKNSMHKEGLLALVESTTAQTLADLIDCLRIVNKSHKESA